MRVSRYLEFHAPLARVAVSTLAAAALAVGCGTETLDATELEGELKTQLGQSAGVEPKSVDCPDDIASKQGEKFECTLVAPNGDEVPVEGTVTNDEGGFEAQVAPEQ